MKSYSWKFPSKIFSLIISLIVIFSALFYGIISYLFSSYKERAEKGLSEYFNNTISVRSIRYSFPNVVILKDVKLQKKKETKDNLSLSLKDIRLSFSLKEFLKKRKFIFYQAYCLNPHLFFNEDEFVFKKERKSLQEIFNLVPQDKEIKFVLRDVLITLKRPEDIKTFILADLTFRLDKGKKISLQGKIKTMTVEAVGAEIEDFNDREALKFDINGYIVNQSFSIEKAEFRLGDLYSKLWGMLDEQMLELNGLMIFHNIFEYESFNKAFSWSLEKIKRKLFFLPKPSPHLMSANSSAVNIFDLHCKVKFSPDDIAFESITFSHNDVPYKINGLINLDSKKLKLRCSTFSDQPESLREKNPRKIDISLDAELKNKKVTGQFSNDFVRVYEHKKALRSVNIKFEEAVLKNRIRKIYDLFSSKIDLTYKTETSSYNLVFDDSSFVFDFNNDRFLEINMFSDIYSGKFKAKALMDRVEFPVKTSCHINVEGVDANKMKSFSSYFDKVYGRFDSNISYWNRPYAHSQGKLVISNGKFNNLFFFNWLGNFFKVDYLNDLEFSTLSSDFSVGPKGSSLKNIDLDAGGIKMSGYFDLAANRLVSSKLLTSISRQVLEDSPRFNFLVKILGNELELINFDFQLSGLYSSINVKWLETDFKDKLQKAIPSFIERGIELKIRQALEGFSFE